MMRSGILTALGVIFGALWSPSAHTETFRFAFQGNLNFLDPYSINETFTLAILGNTYEGLVRRDRNLEIEPALAERWDVIEPTRWRFYLRKGVTFHNGNDFTAEDVAFSMERARSTGSNVQSRLPPGLEIEIIDDHTVDFLLPQPNAILHYQWDNWYIMDKEWTEANDAVAVTSASDTTPNHAALYANGTGPFRITSHRSGVKTSFEKFDDWWDEPEHNLTNVEFTPIASDATRVAALLSGQLDMIIPVPLQDMARIERNHGTRLLTAPDLRTVFLGMDQRRSELLYADVRGANPFQDIRVRKAFYQAIDIDTIRDKIMRGHATPSALLISPDLFGGANGFDRYPYDPDAAKALLEEAGYPDGFSVNLDCPNDRYVNDEAICLAVAAFLARVGVKVDVVSQPKTQFFSKVMPSGGYDTSFYLLGWIPATLESWSLFDSLYQCRNETGQGGTFNLGGYCNPDLDILTDRIFAETEPTARTQLITEAYRKAQADVAYIPLHQQMIAWGTSNALEVSARGDNQIMFRFVQMNAN